jgi:two-component system response regulator AtoC
MSELSVLIEGESGTGKELVAKAIHYDGARHAGSFVVLNCAAVPETLFESELFGYTKGAFTGASQDKPGLFELAQGGTLFLDEIGNVSLEMQKKMLRAIQEKEIRRVGGKNVIKVDTRLICASNRDLKELISTGQFREDLYYRISVIKVVLPPLRDRRDDISLLVVHFLSSIAKETKLHQKTISPDVMALFMKYDWPGNVRELENEIRRAYALADVEIQPSHLKNEILCVI